MPTNATLLYPGKRLPEKCLQEVCSVGVWDASKTQNWGLDWHRNEGVEITYLEKGSLGFSVDGWEGQLMPGNLTVTRPWQKHRVGNPEVGASRLHWLILDVGVRQPHFAWQWPFALGEVIKKRRGAVLDFWSRWR